MGSDEVTSRVSRERRYKRLNSGNPRTCRSRRGIGELFVEKPDSKHFKLSSQKQPETTSKCSSVAGLSKTFFTESGSWPVGLVCWPLL